MNLSENRSFPLKGKGGEYEMFVGSVTLYGAEIWAMTGRMEDILQGMCLEPSGRSGYLVRKWLRDVALKTGK